MVITSKRKLKISVLALFITAYLSPIFSVFAQTNVATLSLSPVTGTFNTGCTFNVDVLLDTGGQGSSGADVYLVFDPTRFKAESITKGTLYKDFVAATTDNTTGEVGLNAISS